MYWQSAKGWGVIVTWMVMVVMAGAVLVMVMEADIAVDCQIQPLWLTVKVVV